MIKLCAQQWVKFQILAEEKRIISFFARHWVKFKILAENNPLTKPTKQHYNNYLC